ncbi:MAG: reverse transcriptase family protein [gamma proteobacterium symbiont of Lucinoma myriamae]|nr:reverse transcriptase family protein [gamma proteobacterium symbiont of Lucinoma myriamae]
MFSPHQFGFRSGYSCQTQLLQVFEEWSEALDNHECVDIIYLDFRKAFDTVPHMRLIKKLEAYGIRGNLLKWIANFLKDRKQKVVVEGCESEWADVVSGIPQGSVLGPLLFLVYINDLPDVIKNLVKIFADDTKLYSIIRSRSDNLALQNELGNLSVWSDDWLLGFNAGKCKSMHLGKKNQRYTYSRLKTTKQSILNKWIVKKT